MTQKQNQTNENNTQNTIELSLKKEKVHKFHLDNDYFAFVFFNDNFFFECKRIDHNSFIYNQHLFWYVFNSILCLNYAICF